MVLTTSCSGGSTPDGSKAVKKGEVSTGTAKGRVDAVTWYGDYRPLYTLDPIKLADYPEETILPNMCEGLLRFSPHYKLEPALAQRWKYTSPTELTLMLRKGVKFWDGTPMTADDVVYSLRRNLDPDEASNYAYLFSKVKKVAATDADTVTITFSQPAPTFVSALTMNGGAIMSKAFGKKAGADLGSPKTGVMCTGPFKFTSYDGSSKLVMTRNLNYWDAGHAALARTFTFEFPADSSALVNGLKSGQIEGGFSIPSSLLRDLNGVSSGRVYVGDKGTSPVSVGLLMISAEGPSAQPVLRQALSRAIDRTAIADKVYYGAADSLYDAAGSGLWGYATHTYKAAADQLAKKYSYDTAAAKKLAKSVPGASKPLSLAYPADSQYTALATAIQQEAKAVGIDIELRALSLQQYGNLFADAGARAKYDMMITKNYVEAPEPLEMETITAIPGGATNMSNYDNAQVAKLLDQASQASDRQKRATLVTEAAKQINTDLPTIPLVQLRSTTFISNKLTGAPLNFTFMTSPWAARIGTP
ncbi:ABC transporter substrate-binding protein [Streptomyces canus]|uniref:ABC transporter substrate-binding protein n=1 Tax=Streptomyces canus TaxID=58343 RepID=UPI0038138084